MDVLKRRPDVTSEKEGDLAKRVKVVVPTDSEDSEDEAELLERLFGGAKPEPPVRELDDEVTEEIEEKKPIEIVETEKDDEDECVWQDEDDDQDAAKSAQTRFAELSAGWLNVKKRDLEEDVFAGKVHVKAADTLPEKVIDIESAGWLGTKGLGLVEDFQLHHLAPVAALAQSDTVVLYQVDGRKNGVLQSIRLQKFKIKCAQIITDNEILCTSTTPWFFTYDIVHGALIRHNHITGYKKGQTITGGGYHTSIESPYIAFPTNRGGINIVSKKQKDHVGTVQSGTNSCVDCHFSRDGNRLWSLAENGEVMCFDLRQMRAVNAFHDMFGATSLAISNDESQFCVGSSSGMINIYDESCQSSPEQLDPLKTLKNLRAPVTLAKFNRSDEMALFASSLVSGQTKLYHAKSNSMFGNFPGERKLGAVKTAQFSPNSGFMGLSNGKFVELFRLNHYAGY